ncbi:MAG: DUF4832 domain-containing protein [Planctomycetota bacterium]
MLAVADVVTYQPSDDVIANPERGWMWTNPAFCSGATSLDFVDFDDLRAQRITLVDQIYVLDAFREGALSQEILDRFESDCARIRAEGMKLVPRFTYNWIESCTGPQDAALSAVQLHLSQLAPLLDANADVIAHVQGSFIGRFGEMHSSSEGHNVPNSTRLSQNGLQIADAILDALPADRTWSMRYPQARQQRHPQPINPADAFAATNNARTGLNNRGFATDPTDFGTWNPDPQVRSQEQAYAEAITRVVPMVGEPGGNVVPGEERAPAEALADLERFHYSIFVINQSDAVGTGVYDDWRDAGVSDVLDRSLGYRYELLSAEVVSARTGANTTLRLEFRNSGFASAINPRPLRLVLRNPTSGEAFEFDTNVPDIRPALPGPGETETLLLSADTTTLASGTYDVLLCLRAPEPSIRERPEYALRLASEGLWEPDTGLHALGFSLSLGICPGDADGDGLTTTADITLAVSNLGCGNF